MILEIFDVEHGACALITTSIGRRLMVDCGHNATRNWKPGTHLLMSGVASVDRLFITNYDEDHVSGYPNLIYSVPVSVLYRNPSVAPAVIRQLKTEDGMGPGIAALVTSIERVFTAGAPANDDLGDTTISLFWNCYGSFPGTFDDENNLSLVLFVTCGHHKIIFPGDMQRAGWLKLLENPLFAAQLDGVTFFVAAHHGRIDGYCEEVLKRCPNIRAFIISDKKKGHQTQETVDLYRPYASGVLFGNDPRRVLTTRRDGSMRINFDPYGFASVHLDVYAA